jgi:hypothetical protein
LQCRRKRTQKNKTSMTGWEGCGFGPPVYLRELLTETVW